MSKGQDKREANKAARTMQRRDAIRPFLVGIGAPRTECFGIVDDCAEDKRARRGDDEEPSWNCEFLTANDDFERTDDVRDTDDDSILIV